MTNLRSMEANDPDFVKDLENSKKWVWIAAKILSKEGHNVTVKTTRVRPTIEEMNSYSDDGDLEINHRIEVKHRIDMNFTCMDEFPYPTVIVDVAHTWDCAKPKPYEYIILNATGSYYISIKSESHEHWVRTERFDIKKKRMRTFYECPKKYCTISKTPDEIMNEAY